MDNGREVRSTSLKYDDGQKATNSGAVRGSYPPLPLSGLVQRPLSYGGVLLPGLARQSFYDLLTWFNGSDSIVKSNDCGLRSNPKQCNPILVG